MQSRGLGDPAVIDTFKLGYANRTLGLRLPNKQRKDGAEIRERLERIGLYRASGHEHFNGSLVVPIFDDAGHVTEMYGRKIIDNLRKGTPKHLYLPGPHRGVFNLAGIAESGGEIILTEALIDALTFWCAGYRNVTAAYGVEGFTGDHLAAFKAHGVKRVVIAFDRDEAGERGAAKIAGELMAEGFECYRVLFPKGMDANEYALKVTPAAKSLGVLIRKAEWLGNGVAPTPPTTAAVDGALPTPIAAEPATLECDPVLPLAASFVDTPVKAAKEEIASEDDAELVPSEPATSSLAAIDSSAALDAGEAEIPAAGACRRREAGASDRARAE